MSDSECQLGGFSHEDSPFSKKSSPFTRKDSPFNKKSLPFSRQDSSFSKLVVCPDWLLQENGAYLLTEASERIRLYTKL